MSDIKKLLNIVSESSTTSGAIAPGAAGGTSMLKRPADSIFAAEDSTQEDCGPEEAPKVDSPSNFGLWKNSALSGKEQKQGGKKVDLKSKEMYPQLKESYGRYNHRDAYERDYDSSVSGFGGRTNKAGFEMDIERWYMVKDDGKLYYVDIWPNQRDQARAQGMSPSREEAKRNAGQQGVAESQSKKSSTKVDVPAPRNFVAKNAINSGAGKHKDKKKAEKQGDIKHKNKLLDIDEGYTVVPGIDRERYVERPGLEGPFGTKSGKAVYYDPKEGKYYDPDTDMYIEYDDWQAMNEGSALGDALRRDLSKQPKLSPQQVQRNKERWAKRQAERSQGVAEGSEERSQNRLWQMITDYEQRAKATKNAIKKDHYLRMASELRGKLKTSDEQGVAESSYQGKGNHRPGWMLKADPELAKKVAANKDRHKAKVKALGNPSAGKSVSQDVAEGQELSEEMIADRLKNELALFKKGSKGRDKDLGDKPEDKEVQSKDKNDKKEES